MIEKIVTKDGSTTLFSYKVNESYRSLHGAVAESGYVFINAGLKARFTNEEELSVLEVGFGTGLNCLLTAIQNLPCRINYVSLDIEPLTEETLSKMNYAMQLGEEAGEAYRRIISSPWDQSVAINEKFTVTKVSQSIIDFVPSTKFDVVYFDPFGPRTQPEAWKYEVFKKIADYCNQQAVLVTYSAKGEVRRMLAELGFQVERLVGPEGKKHMIRATK